VKFGLIFIALAVIVVFGFYFSEGQNQTIAPVGFQKDSEVSQKIDTSTEELKEQYSIDDITKRLGIDRTAIMAVSRRVEICNQELEQLSQLTKKNFDELFSVVENEVTTEDLPLALILLASEKVLNTQTMTQRYESALQKYWEEQAPRSD